MLSDLLQIKINLNKIKKINFKLKNLINNYINYIKSNNKISIYMNKI